MTSWTAHLRRDSEPILIPERFSVGAMVFGPLWLALHRAWLAAALVAAADVLIALLDRPPFDLVLGVALAVVVGMFGHDLRRWSVGHRGYLLAHVLSARDETEALGRLLGRRPDLAAHFMPPGTAR